MTNLLVAAFLVAHAAIHFSFVSPRPPVTAGGPQWPFDLAYSPLLSPLGATSERTRLIGIALVALTAVGFGLAALSTIGLVPKDLFAAALVIGAAGSLGVLGLFFHPWLVLGVAIDIVLIWAVTMASWRPA